MSFKSSILRKICFTLFIGTTLLNCGGGNGENGADPAGSPVGEYQTSLIIKSWTDASGENHNEITTNDCDLLSTVKFNSNNTLQYINYNIGNDDDCSNSEIISGNWIKTASVSGGFYGDFNFSNSFNGEIVNSGRYKDHESGIAIEMNFSTIVNEQVFNYKLNAIKL